MTRENDARRTAQGARIILGAVLDTHRRHPGHDAQLRSLGFGLRLAMQSFSWGRQHKNDARISRKQDVVHGGSARITSTCVVPGERLEDVMRIEPVGAWAPFRRQFLVAKARY